MSEDLSSGWQLVKSRKPNTLKAISSKEPKPIKIAAEIPKLTKHERALLKLEKAHVKLQQEAKENSEAKKRVADKRRAKRGRGLSHTLVTEEDIIQPPEQKVVVNQKQKPLVQDLPCEESSTSSTCRYFFSAFLVVIIAIYFLYKY